ncbi:FAD-dependent oxidoreductase [Planctomycetaceae bacterium]|nr:FAD-dependent oxidoreductase [Planctomycetaceae bacterium]
MRLFHDMLEANSNITIMKSSRRHSTELNNTGISLERIHFINGADEKFSVQSRMFIDATYEGDLMAAAGVDFRVGRESHNEHNESLAPVVADGQVQGYNFRLTMTNRAANRVWPQQPDNYNREFYLELLPLIASGQIEKPFHITTLGSNKKAIYKAHDPVLPNGKFDINDMSRGNVRLSLPQFNNDWPEGDADTRGELFDLHVKHNIGMLYFFQNDEAVPEQFRQQAREWGFCRDEFVDSRHLPVQLYVREARRMVGMTVFTQQNTSAHSPTSVRAILAPDAIAQGDYGPNCHGTGHDGPLFGGQHTGEFYLKVAPYQIPYGTIVPRKINNLLVPVAVSSSHVGFCALRLEPIWISLGEAAGTAAHLALQKNRPVQNVSVVDIRRLLHRSGCATIYVSDVPRSSPDFERVQWWGSLGGWHGVSQREDEYGQRGPHFRGQYYEAFSGHAAELQKALDTTLAKKWRNLAADYDLEIDSTKMKSARTRGDFLRAVTMPN